MMTVSIFYQPSATLHCDTILRDISGFTFLNGLPEEMNPLKSRPEHKGILDTTREKSSIESPLVNVGKEWEEETLLDNTNFQT